MAGLVVNDAYPVCMPYRSHDLETSSCMTFLWSLVTQWQWLWPSVVTFTITVVLIWPN